LHFDTLKHLFFPLNFHPGFVTSTATELKDFFPGNGDMPWLLTIYPGMIITILALFGLIFAFSKNILLWLITFVVTIVLAMGSATPVHYFFYKLFPFFRFPEKFMLLANFSLLVIAAYGFDRFLYILKRKGIRQKYLFHLIAVLLVGDLFLANRYVNPVCESAFYRFYDPMLQPILDDRERFRVYVDPKCTLPPSVANTIVNHRIGAQSLLAPHLGILQNLDHLAGHTPLELLYQYVIKTEILTKPWENKIHFLRLANVKYIISSQGLDKNSELMPYITKINSIIYKVNNHLPRAWIVGDLLPIRQNSINELINPSFNAAFSAFTKGDIVSKYNSPYFKNIDCINYDKNGDIRVELTAYEPGVLVVAESAYPRWQVFVDGVEKQCLYLNCLFLGVEIDKGMHNVVLRYRPLYFHFFLSISLVSLSLFFLTFICFRVFLKNGNRKT